MTDDTIPTTSTLKHKANALAGVSYSGLWRSIRGQLSAQERELVAAGLTSVEAIYFIEKAALTPTEEWLMNKGAHPYAARELAKTRPSDFETSLIIGGVDPVTARMEAHKPATEYDVKAAIVSMTELSSDPIFNKPEQLTDQLAMAIRGSRPTKSELYETQFILRDNRTISIGDGLLKQTVSGYISQNTRRPQVAKTLRDTASGSTTSSAPISAGSASEIRVVTTAAIGAASNSEIQIQPVPIESKKPGINATLKRMLAGDVLDKATIESVQIELNRLGYDCGKSDGLAGSQTWKAIASYAKAGNMASERVDRSHLGAMEEALKVVGYKQIKADGQIDAETRRSVDKFFRLRQSTLGDFRPADVQSPDFAALAAIQSGYSQKRGLAPAVK